MCPASTSRNHPGLQNLGQWDPIYPRSVLFMVWLHNVFQRAGIETNPGPKCPCGVCTTNVAWNCYSVLCTDCKHWIHLKCSGLNSTKDYNKDFRCRICSFPQPQTDPPTTPIVSSRNKSEDFKILQLNCNGIRGKIDEIIHHMNEKKQDPPPHVSIAAFQETKLPKNSKLSTLVGHVSALTGRKAKQEA